MRRSLCRSVGQCVERGPRGVHGEPAAMTIGKVIAHSQDLQVLPRSVPPRWISSMLEPSSRRETLVRANLSRDRLPETVEDLARAILANS